MTQNVSSGKTLAARRAAETRRVITDAAVPLFVAQGYEATSMEQVAAAVGVSRRTLYRYFDSKEDIVFDHPRRWLERLEDVLSGRRPGEPTREVLRRGLAAVAEFVESEAPQVLAAFSILGSSPMLGARHGRSDAQWVQRYVELMAADGSTPQHATQSLVAAMAIVAGQNAVMILWARAHPANSAATLMMEMLDQLDGAWPEACR